MFFVGIFYRVVLDAIHVRNIWAQSGGCGAGADLADAELEDDFEYEIEVDSDTGEVLDLNTFVPKGKPKPILARDDLASISGNAVHALCTSA
jgi:hypothetical protein